VLPEAQREVVVMHYAEGRTCEEISAITGRSPVAVRVALHRARRQLRERLAPSLAHATPIRREDYPMAEVTVEDVVVRMLPDADQAEQPADHLRVVLLREKQGGRVLPIWIGAPEGNALALQLGDESTPRPLTADLIPRLLEAAGARVERVTVTSLKDKTFYSVITLAGATGVQDIDARPSDALNLAARVGAPIFVEDDVLAEAAVAADDDLMDRLTHETAEHVGELDPNAQWRSLSPAVVKSMHKPWGGK
jgi:bifunctional DNase/RNase